MATLEDALAYGLQAMIAANPATVVFTDRTTLSGTNPAPNPLFAENLVLDGAALAGAGTINLSANLMTGRVIAGDQFTIAGDGTLYTISGQVISPTTEDTLTAVPFTPVLTQNESDGAAVTITPLAQTTLTALVSHFPTALINGTSILATDLRVRFLASALTGVIPATGDLIEVEGFNRSIIAVQPMSSQGTVYGYRCQVRG